MSTIVADLEHVIAGAKRPAIIMQEYGTPSIYEAEYEMRSTRIADGRKAANQFNLDEHGFAFLNRPTAVTDFDDEAVIRSDYYSEIEDLIKAETGAARIDIFDHTIRHSAIKPGVRGVASHVHNDYTEWSLPQKLKDHLGYATATEILKRKGDAGECLAAAERTGQGCASGDCRCRQHPVFRSDRHRPCLSRPCR